MTILANPRRMALKAMADAWEPPPPVDYEAWAKENIEFTPRESQFPGRYNPEQFPFFGEIFRALSPDDPCRTVSFAKSAQLGGTVLANIFCLGSVDMDPCDFLYTHPSEDNARRWSRLKLTPMLRGSDKLQKLFPEKSRDGADNVLFKEASDGRSSILVSGANSPSSLSQVSMRKQVQDDLAKWQDNKAGDPEDQANSRSRGFTFAKIFKISTPLVEPGCRITRNFKDGSQEYLHVPCPHCGHPQVLEWENFLENLDPEHPEKACLTCIDSECGGVIQEHHRDEMNRRGRWIAKKPERMREHRSFHLWSAYSPLQSFELIAREYLSSRGKPDKEKVFLNDTVGRAYEVKGEAPPWEEIRNRADASGHARGTIPIWGLIVTVGVDVQDGWLKWQAVGWSRDGRRAVIDARRIDGDIKDEATRKKLDELLASTWPHASGQRIGIDMLGIDGNAWTENVWDWAKRHPISKVIMLRGIDGDDKPLIARVKKERHRITGQLLKYSRRFYNFAASVLKWSLYKNLAITDPLKEGFVAIPRQMGDDYFQELTAERRVKSVNKSGFTVYSWEKDADQRNEDLDTMNQAEAAAIKFGIRDLAPGTWDAFEAARATPIESPQQLDLEEVRPVASTATVIMQEVAKPLSPRERAEKLRAEQAPPKAEAEKAAAPKNPWNILRGK